MDIAEKEKIFQTAGIDFNAGLARFMGNEDLYKKYLISFLYDSSFQELCIGTEIKDMDMIWDLAVTLKGTTANLSLDHLANEVDHLLQNIIILRTNNDAGLSLQPALEKLNSAYKASCDAIAEVYAS